MLNFGRAAEYDVEKKLAIIPSGRHSIKLLMIAGVIGPHEAIPDIEV